MWPWGHAAVGYLLYSAICRWRTDQPPRGAPTLLLGLGTQLPDLIDKPFAWTVSVLPSGRSLGHSFLFVLPVIGLGYWYARKQRYPELGIAFGVGFLTHPLGDILYSLLDGEFQTLSFLLWPLLELPTYETEPSFLAHLTDIEPTPDVIFELFLFGLAVAVWVVDATPGLAQVRRWLRSRAATRS